MKEIYDDFIPEDMKTRVLFQELDFLQDQFPQNMGAVIFGAILHDWDDKAKLMLI